MAVKRSHLKRNVALALLVLVAITIVVFYVAWQSQTYGCGSFCATYQIAVGPVSCSNLNGTCTLRLVNTGTADGRVVGCMIDGASGVLSPSPATVPAGQWSNLTCRTSTGSGTGSGNSVQGEVKLQEGLVVPWASTWQ